jgi:5'-nucleotidase
MKILLTNDDGIDAEGLECLQQSVGGELYVVAPADHVSECGHRITTRTALKLEQRGERRWAVHGSPADCVRVAVKHLYSSITFDWVLSGVNQGGNLGIDLYYSGTAAAAREAAIFGIRSIAFSHYIRREIDLDWQHAGRRVQRVWKALGEILLEPGRFWNVNLPHLEAGIPEPELRFCEPCKHPLPVVYTGDEGEAVYSGRYPDRLKTKGSDTDLCFGGAITVSQISI